MKSENFPWGKIIFAPDFCPSKINDLAKGGEAPPSRRSPYS
jgi:hypothetical protein